MKVPWLLLAALYLLACGSGARAPGSGGGTAGSAANQGGAAAGSPDQPTPGAAGLLELPVGGAAGDAGGAAGEASGADMVEIATIATSDPEPAPGEASVFLETQAAEPTFDRAGVVGTRRFAFDSSSLALVTFDTAGTDTSPLLSADIVAGAGFRDDLLTPE